MDFGRPTEVSAALDLGISSAGFEGLSVTARRQRPEKRLEKCAHFGSDIDPGYTATYRDHKKKPLENNDSSLAHIDLTHCHVYGLRFFGV